MEELFGEEGVGPEPNRARAQEITLYRRGEKILLEGEKKPFFFVILSGNVRISCRGKKLRVLGEQDIFGLESLVLQKLSCYSAEALRKCRIAKYGPDTLEYLIHECPRMVKSLLMSTLHQLTQVPQVLAGDSAQLPIDEGRVKFLNDGETLRDGKRVVTDFYRLVSTQGGLRVTIGRKEVARIDRPGEFFGGVAGLRNLPSRAHITSIGESVIETYSLEDLDVLIRDYPEAAGQIMRAMVKRLAEVERTSAGTQPANPDL